MTEALAPIDPGGWAPYLDPDEELLWEGAPATGVRFRLSDLPLTIFGLFFGGFAVFWVAMAGWMAGDGPDMMGLLFPLFGLPFVAVGLYLAVGRFFWKAYVRSKTRYALTTRRAIVAISAAGRSMKSWPIRPETSLDYRPGDREATIYFAREERRGSEGGRYYVSHGFEYIPDGDHVYRLMRSVRGGSTGDNA